MAQATALLLGDIQLAGPTPQAGVDYRIEALAGGTHLGNPKALREFVKSVFVDGSLSVSQGTDNREPVIQLRISAPEAVAGPALAQAEKALTIATRKKPRPDPLTYVPPATGAAVTVADVEAADLTRDHDGGGSEWDLEEVLREYRYYTLSLSCWPWVRPADTVVVPAIAPNPPTPTTVDIDLCNSTTGWSKAAAGFGPTVRTNRIPNPSFETNLDGWNAGTNAFLPQPSTMAWDLKVGNYLLRCGFVNGSYGQRAYLDSPAVAVTAGKKYAISMRLGGGRPPWGFLARFYNGPNGTGSMVQQIDVSETSRVVTAPPNAVSLRLFPFVTAHSFDDMLLDGVLVEESDTVYGYFDGDTPDGSGWVFAWTGTPHASTSTATSTTAATSLSASGGHVDLSGVAGPAYGGTRTLTLTRTGAVAMGATPYLRVSAAVSVTGGTATPVFKIGTGTAVPVTPEVVAPSAIAGYTDYYFTTGSFDRLVIEATAAGGSNTPTVNISVAHVARTDAIAGAGTLRQVARTATVTGAAPTQAAIRLYDATEAPLGTDILVYTSTNTSWIPALRPFRVSSSTVGADPARVSGFANTLASAMVFRIPARRLTEGTYSLLANLNVIGAATLTWSTRIVSSTGAATIGSSQTQSGSTLLINPLGTGYRVYNLASLLLPPALVEGDQMVEITLGGGGGITIDEAWLFCRDDGVLTWIPDTDSMSWIEIRSPEIGSDSPTIYGGTGEFGENPVCVDWKTSMTPAYGACGQHVTEPGQMQVFTVCTTSQAAQSELEFYPRYHSHVVDEAA
jgi:hypothetical protein